MIMVRSVRREASVAGIITISKGHDASYPWRQIGTGTGRTAGRRVEAGAGYYLSPAEKGGEPPGIWTGKGVAELGLRPAGIVDRAVFEPLYGKHLDPRDPAGQERLGRAPSQFRSAEDVYQALLAAEPEATAERRAQLLAEAKSLTRTPDLYWDATFSVSKSISLFHASALANSAAAAEQGDLEAVQRWEQVAEDIWAAIMEGNAAALDYLQREAGQTRAGYHPGGRWEDAREWVIASFRQHTSRDGDPQLHVHNLILHKVRRESDGAWRALDSMSLYRHRPAASAIGTLAAENALTRRFGVRWVPRRDGHGREIEGVGQMLMDMFSSRRQSIGPMTARLAQAYEAQFGRAPDARALASLRQWANHATRRGKDGEALDLDALVRHWAAQARASESGALEPLAPAVVSTGAPGASLAPGAPGDCEPGSAGPLTGAQVQHLIQEAVAAVQTVQPAWTEADLIRRLGERLPAATGPMTAQVAAALLPELARRALASEAVMLAAPEWPRVPDCLRRASGESMYVPHGATRYATGAQLALEERLLARAQETGAPRLEPAIAAHLLGAEQAHLEAQLSADDDCGAIPESTGSGLRADQAAAAYLALTSARRAEVIAGPAGSGKTRTVAEMARMWREAGSGEVVGLTTSQTAANVLAEAGVPRVFNTARFLGHLEGRREALAPQPVEPGSLLILDEASMMSIADIAAILAIARARDCKVVITGDHEQLAAVEGGGAMAMLARRLGFVQLAEPQRFTAAWEREATLRLRAGDVTVLADYDDHGRLRGGTPEDATEQAYRGWLADYLDGTDTVLIARTEDQARELSRRARDDLIRYGRVTAGPAARLAAGEQASGGELIMARRNARAGQPARPDRELTNRDILQVICTTAGPAGTRVEVRRLTGRDTAGQPAWSAPFTVPRRYLADHAALAYATTAHAALGRTTGTAHVLVDGLADRQALYVAMSRGRDANYAYCITQGFRSADVRAGSAPAPELDRARRLDREHQGLPAPEPLPDDDPAPAADPIAVLAGILTRDGSQLTATDTLDRELSRADHLAILGGIWDDLTRRAQQTRFENALRHTLPAALAEQAMADPASTWLWRTLREAEAAGIDGEQAFRRAVAERSMAGVRDIARVLDARLRRALDGIPPQPPGSWSARVPVTSSDEINRYLRELAEAMDDRTRRLGEHTAQTQPPWACHPLGPVPEHRADRAGWEHRASQIAAYRERYGYAHPDDPIGPEPSKNSPEARAAWHAALAALGRVDGIDLRGCTDGALWLRRGTYERETAWAPPHVAEELRLMRIAERDAHVSAVRAEHDARAAHDNHAAARHNQLARTWRALEAKAAREADMFAAAQDTRRHWEAVTESTRQTAIAADIELRRRHPGMRVDPLRPHPTEAEHVTHPAPTKQQDPQIQLAFDDTADLFYGGIRPGQQQDSPEKESADQARLALGLTPATAEAQIPEQVRRIHENSQLIQAKLDELASTPLPGESQDLQSPGLAWPAPPGRQRAAVLQPPRPEITPAARVADIHHDIIRDHAAGEPERG
jgi:conjugative relaxase-like TrwC/TraI family protein